MHNIYKKSIIIMTFFFAHVCVSDNQNVKLRIAVFIPTSKLFREIYTSVGPCLQLEYAYRYCQYMDVWANIDEFWRHGKSVGMHNPTKINIVNVSTGIKVPYHLKECDELYLGIGPSIAHVLIKNESCCTCEKSPKAAIGVIIKSGYYYRCDCIIVDLFADYLYQPAHFQKRVNIGALKVGIGFGASF